MTAVGPNSTGPVRTALQKHPQLTRYIVCLPIDLPDARAPGQQSALEKWDARVEKWKAWASGRGMTVEFAYWGSSELLERLTKPEHVGRVQFWFDATGFDENWFARRFEEARGYSGTQVHTGSACGSADRWPGFEAFGRTRRFFDRTIASIRRLEADWSSACSYGPSRLGKGKRCGGRGRDRDGFRGRLRVRGQRCR